MSIINEALKKAGEPRHTPGPPAKHPGKMILFIFVIFTAAAAAFFIVRHNRVIPPDVIPVVPPPQKTIPVVPPPAAVPTAPETPILNLNGIVYDEERPYAIVNNKVMMKGDVIDGAALVEIGRNSVKFIYNDKEIVLNAQ
ncbi:MAG: hypothetical protein PHO42_01520 [Candidatus Omnitrophica bacterium]|nr:hypothetical protein [Candidatus Omnitrophota bacterium]